LRGELSLTDGIYGNLYAEGVKMENLSLESMSFEFNGKEFTGKLNYFGMELSGKGRIILNPKEPLRSRVSALFRGKNLSVEVFGTIDNLRVRPR